LIVLPVLKHSLDLIGDCNSADVKKDHINHIKFSFITKFEKNDCLHRDIITWPYPDSNETSSSGYPSVYSTGNQHSSRLLSMNAANCIVKLPSRTEVKKTVSSGEILSALIIEKI